MLSHPVYAATDMMPPTSVVNQRADGIIPMGTEAAGAFMLIQIISPSGSELLSLIGSISPGQA